MDVAQARAVLTLEDSQFQQATRRAAQSFDRMGREVEATGKRVSANVGAALSSLGGRMSLAVTAPLAALGAASVRSATQMDSLKRGLTAVAGSSAEAERQLVRLNEIAKLPGLNRVQAIQMSTRLQAAGLSANTAERSLLAFGNALATVGKGSAELDGVAIALTQITAKGKITAEEINQIAERVPQIRVAMQAAFGTANTEKLQEMGMTARQFIEGVNDELLKLPRVTGGAQNAFENMQDAIQKALATIGQQLLPTVLPMVERITRGAVELAEGFGKLPAPVRQAILVMGALALAAGPVLLGMGQLITAFGAVKTASMAMKASFIALPLPLKLITLAVGALAAAWAADFGGMRTTVTKFVGFVTPYLRGMWEVLKVDFVDFIDNFKAGWKQVSDWFQNVFILPFQTGVQMIREAMSNIGSAIGEALGPVGDWLGKAGQWIMDRVPGLDAVRDWFAGIPAMMERFRVIGQRAMDRDRMTAGDPAAVWSVPPADPGTPGAPEPKEQKQTPFQQDMEAMQRRLNQLSTEARLRTEGYTDSIVKLGGAYKNAAVNGAGMSKILELGEAEAMETARTTIQVLEVRLKELMSGDTSGITKIRHELEDMVPPAVMNKIQGLTDNVKAWEGTARARDGIRALRQEIDTYATSEGEFARSAAARRAMEETGKKYKELTQLDKEYGAELLNHGRILNNNRESAQRYEQEQQNLASVVMRSNWALHDAHRAFEAFAQGGIVGRMAMEQFGVSLKDLPTRVREAVTATIEHLIQIDQAQQMLQTFSDGVRSTFSDMFMSLQDGFGGFFRSLIDGFKQTLVQMAAEYLTSQLHRIVMDQLGGLVGSFFGGAAAGTSKGWHAPMALPGRAMGGPVRAGQPYMVGEQGREVFLPRQSGHIVPNHQLAGAGGPSVTVNFHITATDADSFRRDKRSLMADAFEAARRAQRRDGS
jgi:tape measure domain-containing protein